MPSLVYVLSGNQSFQVPASLSPLLKAFHNLRSLGGEVLGGEMVDAAVLVVGHLGARTLQSSWAEENPWLLVLQRRFLPVP